MKRCLLPTIAVSGVLFMVMAFAGNVPADDVEKKEKEKEKKSFEAKLWDYFEKVEYQENFSPWPGTKDKFFPGESPHGAQLKVYVNQHVVKKPDDPPHNSIIIKENYTEEEKLAAITIMYRVENYDSDNKDWYWVKYMPNGKVAKMDDMKLAGKVKGCIKCHSSAKGGDYIFMNDE